MTNATTGVANALGSRAPILVLSGGSAVRRKITVAWWHEKRRNANGAAQHDQLRNVDRPLS
jgi:thiamine pyrophosphate-dependent acetolactate synthase large subunit-like protein